MRENGINPEAFVVAHALRREAVQEAAAKAERIKQFRENNDELYKQSVEEPLKLDANGIENSKVIIELVKGYAEAGLDDFFTNNPEQREVAFGNNPPGSSSSADYYDKNFVGKPSNIGTRAQEICSRLEKSISAVTNYQLKNVPKIAFIGPYLSRDISYSKIDVIDKNKKHGYSLVQATDDFNHATKDWLEPLLKYRKEFVAECEVKLREVEEAASVHQTEKVD